MTTPNQTDAKVHPASREILPDDPLEMHACETPGDPELMMRLLVEEYARMGWGSDAILQLARDPQYQAFHGLWLRYGEDELRRRVTGVLSKCGVIRVTAVEKQAPAAEPLVQIGVPSRPAAPRRPDQ